MFTKIKDYKLYTVSGIITKGTKKNDFMGTREEGWSLEYVDLWQLENIKVDVYKAEDISFRGEEIQFVEDSEPIDSITVSDPDLTDTRYNAPFEFKLPRGDYYAVVHKVPGYYATVYKKFQVIDRDVNIFALPMRKEKIKAEFVDAYVSCKPDGSIDPKNNSITLKVLNAKVAPDGASRNTILIDGIPKGLYVEEYVANTEDNTITVIFGGQREDEIVAGVILTATIMEKAVINEYFPGSYSYDVSNKLNGIRLVQQVDERDIMTGKASYAQALTFVPGEAYPVDDAKDSIKKIENVYSKVLEILYKEGLQEDGSCKYGLYLINTNVTDTYIQRHSKGITPRGWEWTGLTWDDIPGSGGNNVLVRISRSEYGHGHGTTSLELHEMAHNIDKCVFQNISASEEWKTLMDRESKELYPNDINYMTAFSEEYFAESYMLYYLNAETRQWLQEKAPNTYKAIHEGLPQKLNELYGKDPKYKHLFK